jgi:excisionase family DNA binding protein
MTDHKQYLRATEIAALTGISLRTVRRWIADGIVPSTKFGGARLVSKIELELLLSSPAMTPERDVADDNA